ncbi:hypothetical protein TrCOL_g9228 [Triparma columacea]|uniref:tRNA (guanine(37)-N1)-methyltransferase n=1 Tax=Triparma columacea TaxID=722753 RepID=A0A9W7LA75_9STRA|nr:hypothetical protein TrCOL_g9228 [Triparma columacea]
MSSINTNTVPSRPQSSLSSNTPSNTPSNTSSNIPSHLPLDPSGKFVLPSAIDPSSYLVSTSYISINLPAQSTGKMMKQRSYLLNLPRRKNVYSDPSDPTRRVVVTGTPSGSTIPSPLKSLVDEEEGWEFDTFSIERGYNDMTVEEVLRTIITDKDVEIPTSFESVGHIAHMNLRDNVLPYKYVVGKVIMDKNTPITKVITKVGTIETEFRTFSMECIAGQDDGDYVVEVKEEGNRFKFDFEKVYWNSKLAGEHRRVVQEIGGQKKGKGKGKSNRDAVSVVSSPTPVVADIMAGVGPFAIPLTSDYNVTVLANDLNPSSYSGLVNNGEINKCGELLVPSNLDGREFIHKLSDEGTKVDYVIMNLPQIAVEFLDAFRGWDFGRCGEPIVYVYGFYKGEIEDGWDGDYKGMVKERCENALGTGIKGEFDIHRVRDVAPKKPMICARFVLPREVGEMERVDLKDYVMGVRKEEGGDKKRLKIGTDESFHANEEEDDDDDDDDDLMAKMDALGIGAGDEYDDDDDDDLGNLDDLEAYFKKS